MLFYKCIDGKLVISKAANMAGFIGAKTIEEAKYELILETNEDSMVTSSLYRKNTEDFLLIQDFTAEFSVYVRADSLQALLDSIKLLQPLHEFTDFVNTTYEDADEDSETNSNDEKKEK
jgi:hypothetical protein